MLFSVTVPEQHRDGATLLMIPNPSKRKQVQLLLSQSEAAILVQGGICHCQLQKVLGNSQYYFKHRPLFNKHTQIFGFLLLLVNRSWEDWENDLIFIQYLDLQRAQTLINSPNTSLWNASTTFPFCRLGKNTAQKLSDRKILILETSSSKTFQEPEFSPREKCAEESSQSTV